MKKLVLLIVLICTVWVLVINLDSNDYDNTEEMYTTSEEEEESYPISLQTTDDYTMIEASPYMLLYANNQAFTDDVNDFIEAYNSTPEWLRRYCTEFYLESDDNYRAMRQRYSGYTEDSVGYAYSDGQGNRYVYVKLRYKNEDGEPVSVSQQPYNQVIAHELGHHYDFYNYIVKSYDTTILQNNLAGVCEATGVTNCQDSLKEGFANAMSLYITNPDALPQDLRAWMDSLPK